MQFLSKHVLIAASSAAIAICVAVFSYLILALPGDDKAGASDAARIAPSIQQLVEKDAAIDPQLFRFYAKRAFAPLWWNENGVTADAQQTKQVLATAADHGLPAQRYASTAAPAGRTDAEKATFDLSLTRAALTYARDMRDGMLRPRNVFSDVSLGEKPGDITPDFTTAADARRISPFLIGLEPAAPEYRFLKTALQRYRALGHKPWPTVMASKRPSERLLTLVRDRLATEGYLTTGMNVDAALRLYQAENGLRPDGKLDEKTVSAMNVKASSRAEQIAANLERWRWLPQTLEDRHIMVNVADASLALVEGGAISLRSRVVVGAPNTPTPILMARANAVTVNPTWHLPKSIIENEIKPKLAEDPDYLARKNMVEDDGEITQQPGPGNALGTLKFEFPNPFDVYLHDTPAKQAFQSAYRAVSHGCVRVERVRQLAATVLGVDEPSLDQLIAAGETVRRPLKSSLAIYIQYWSAVPGADGRIGFRADVYGRDGAMIAAMHQGAFRLAQVN